MRLGPIMLRYVGPTARCNCVRENYKTNTYFEGNEPYATLSTFRAHTGIGVLFGSYFQVDFLSNKKSYDEALPEKLGYDSYSKACEKNPKQTFVNDKFTYVRVYKDDSIHLRVRKVPKWIPDLNERNLKRGEASGISLNAQGKRLRA